MSQAVLFVGGRAGHDEARLRARRRARAFVLAEHAGFVLLLVSGVLLMRAHGWGLGHPRWLLVKLGLVAFLVVPLEGMHAYVHRVWIARGLRETPAPPFSRTLARGIGVDEMIRTLAVPLLGIGVPLILWLSRARPW